MTPVIAPFQNSGNVKFKVFFFRQSGVCSHKFTFDGRVMCLHVGFELLFVGLSTGVVACICLKVGLVIKEQSSFALFWKLAELHNQFVISTVLECTSTNTVLTMSSGGIILLFPTFCLYFCYTSSVPFIQDYIPSLYLLQKFQNLR